MEDTVVAAGDRGGDGIPNLSRNLVAFDVDEASESSGDIGLSLSYDFGCLIS